ncbi:DEAD/DEAH box helicase family protein [Anaerosinus massiliensis]|uniref:DEAD/DEAH box helicase family protein n=1 Tax=Massilibacillus massiliensis TaxID=1806837 RepID=UPI000AB21FFD|nr:DEAD/DEAH box helicase family protein [Massilibacillus massiliensis]
MAIRVIDSIMGSGKTEWAIQYMNQNPQKKFMYITPYNNEIKDRIIPKCPELNFKFAKEGNKVNDFKSALEKGQSITATHECFKRVDDDVKSLLEANKYTLILDEVFDVVIDLHMAKADVQVILANFATVNDGYLVWTNEEYPDEGGKFSDIKKMAKLNKIMVYSDAFFLWTFPVDMFEKFSEVYILTYLFAGQIQRYYFDLKQIDYEYFKVQHDVKQGYSLGEHDFTTHNNLKGLIDIYDGSLNDIGDKSTALSKSWQDKPQNKAKLKALKNNIRNFFIHINKAKSNDIIWTCFKSAELKLKGDGYAKGFVECNCRSTNKYADRTYVAYCCNRFIRPVLKNDYFKAHGVEVDEDLWALSEMIQFLWRSAIRNGKKIYVYIPSKRMRDLLKAYLDNTLDVDYGIRKIEPKKAS